MKQSRSQQQKARCEVQAREKAVLQEGTSRALNLAIFLHFCRWGGVRRMGQVWIKIRRKGFQKSLEPGAVGEEEVCCLQRFGQTKEERRLGSGEVIMPTFSALCFQPRNAQIAADIAEWFPAAL